MSETATIQLHGQPVTKAAMRAFKKAYEAARRRGDLAFDYQGKPVISAYAKYVVEYAETAFEEKL